MSVNSLTSPADRPDNWKHKPKPRKILEEAESEAAYDDKFIEYPEIDQVWVDPVYRDQKYVLVSFEPSKTAKPDKDGFFGMMKVRGVFSSDAEMNDRAMEIIRTVDSYHFIAHAKVGHPFPVTSDDEKFCREVKSVDVRNKAVQLVSDGIKEKRLKEKQELEEVKQREKDLLEKVDKQIAEDQDPLERYIEINVKKANQIHTVVEAYKKINEFKKSISDCQTSLAEIEAKHPNLKDKWMETYLKSLADVGIDPSENMMLQYLNNPVPFSLEDTNQLNLPVVKSDRVLKL